MWTYTDNLTLLENLIVRSHFKDGVFRWFELYPVDGYVLHIPSGDYTEYDDEGNIIIYDPYYTWGGAMVIDANYDWTTNPEGYEALPYEDGMIVLGSVKPPHEIM